MARITKSNSNISRSSSKIFKRYSTKTTDRENVPETKFRLRNLAWSPWQSAILRRGQRKASFIQRDVIGFRCKKLFDGKCDVPALYELSVKIKPRSRRAVVYYTFSSGFRASRWEKALLGNPVIQQQMNGVLVYGCEIQIRRLILKSERYYFARRENELQEYDYAWTDCRGTGKHRKLFIKNVPISLEFQEN